jgi:predicted metalloprotease with PDZ domain
MMDDEGVTEYFANLPNQSGLITEKRFYNRLSDQMEQVQ